MFPKPLLRKEDENLNLSFSGLKSHVIKLINDNKSNLKSKNFYSRCFCQFSKNYF